MSIGLPWRRWLPWFRPGRVEPGERSGEQVAGSGGVGRSTDTAVADARFGGEDDPSAEWVTVHVAAGAEEAYLVKSALDAAQIPTMVRHESWSRAYGALAAWGVEVQVPRTHEDQARHVLEEAS